jgi:ArsR family transcriptional regulator
VADPTALEASDRARLVAVFRALGDATRFEVFRLIAAQREPLCVCDVVGRFGLSQPTISYHLKVLREAGLVTVSQRGVWAYYAADAAGLRLLAEAADTFAPAGAAVPA